jgi:hypothetical protein
LVPEKRAAAHLSIDISNEPPRKYHILSSLHPHTVKLNSLFALEILAYCLISQEVDTMHLTTLISLLAAGAVTAPAASLDLNTRMARPKLSNLDLPKAPEITNLVRRQEAEDPVEETPEESSSSSSSSSTAADLIPELPTLLRRQELAATKEPSADSKDAAKIENDPLEAYLHALDGEGEYDEKASGRALDRYHASLEKAKSNSTTSAVTTSTSVAPVTKTTIALPELTKNSDPLAMLSGLLPVKRDELSGLPDLPLVTKRQDLPELPEIPNVEGLVSPTKRQLEGLTGATPKVDEEDVPAPDVKEYDITPMVDGKVIGSNASAVNSTVADASTTSSAGYANINKHMDKLNKVPLGLPVKRQAPEFSNTPVAAPEIADDQSTGSLPTEPEFDADSPLHKFLVPLHR